METQFKVGDFVKAEAGKPWNQGIIGWVSKQTTFKGRTCNYVTEVGGDASNGNVDLGPWLDNELKFVNQPELYA